MENQKRDFKGIWIPKEIWLDTRLNATEKIILVEIDSLDSSERGCWASNKHLAEFCQCSERTVSNAISKLVEYGYIYIKSFDGRNREIKSKYTLPSSLEINSEQHRKNCEAEKKKLRESNTENNTPNASKERKKKAGSYDDILSDIDDSELKELYFEYIKMRKLIKKPMTDRALKMLVSKVNALEPTSIDRQKKLLENAISSNWLSVYPLKDDNKQSYNQNKKPVPASSDYDFELDNFWNM